MKRYFLILFLAATVSVLLSEIIDLPTVYLVSKPLLMASLLAYYFASVPSGFRSRTVIFAILFSFAGDVLLMNEKLFIPGLVSFLTAHILYMVAYRHHQETEATNPLAGVQRVRLAFPVILAATGLVVILLPVLGNLKIPVIIYAIVLAMMVLSALFRSGKTSIKSFWMVFIGAVLFMISDSILAVNKFLRPVPAGGVWIMASYCAAQLLIVSGLIRHPNVQLSEA